MEKEEKENQFWVRTKTLTELASDGWRVQGDQIIHRKYINISESYKHILGNRAQALITSDGRYFTVYSFPSTKFPTSILKDGGFKYQIHLMKQEIGLYEKFSDS